MRTGDAVPIRIPAAPDCSACRRALFSVSERSARLRPRPGRPAPEPHTAAPDRSPAAGAANSVQAQAPLALAGVGTPAWPRLAIVRRSVPLRERPNGRVVTRVATAPSSGARA